MQTRQRLLCVCAKPLTDPRRKLIHVYWQKSFFGPRSGDGMLLRPDSGCRVQQLLHVPAFDAALPGEKF